MSENTFDIDSVRQIEALAKSLGGLAECKRLGFIFEDGQGVMSLSVAGLGLSFVRESARNYKSRRSLRRGIRVCPGRDQRQRLTKSEQDALLAQDEVLRKKGDVVLLWDR